MQKKPNEPVFFYLLKKYGGKPWQPPWEASFRSLVEDPPPLRLQNLNAHSEILSI